MDTLGSGLISFLVFVLTAPVRSEGGGVRDCVEGVPCADLAPVCFSLLGQPDVLGPFSCSPWGAAAAALLAGLAARAVGGLRRRARTRPRRGAGRRRRTAAR